MPANYQIDSYATVKKYPEQTQSNARKEPDSRVSASNTEDPVISDAMKNENKTDLQLSPASTPNEDTIIINDEPGRMHSSSTTTVDRVKPEKKRKRNRNKNRSYKQSHLKYPKEDEAEFCVSWVDHWDK